MFGLNKYYLSNAEVFYLNCKSPEWVNVSEHISELFSRVWGQYAFIISLCRQPGEASGWLNGNQWNQMSLNSFTAALRKFSLILLPCRENVKWLDVCEWLLWWKCGEEEIQGQGQTCLAAWLLFPGSMVTKMGISMEKKSERQMYERVSLRDIILSATKVYCWHTLLLKQKWRLKFLFVILYNYLRQESINTLHFKANISNIFMLICSFKTRWQSSVTLAASLRQGNRLMQTQKPLGRTIHTQFQMMEERKETEGKSTDAETEVLYIKVKISRLYLRKTFPLNPKNKTRKARKPHHM